MSLGDVLSTLFGDRVVSPQSYSAAAVRFCARCDISTRSPRCEWCGRFTSNVAPPSWSLSTTQRDFTAQVRAAVRPQ